MRLLRLIFGTNGPHREEERQASSDLDRARERNRDAIDRNIAASEQLQKVVRERGMIEALTDGVLKEVKRK